MGWRPSVKASLSARSLSSSLSDSHALTSSNHQRKHRDPAVLAFREDSITRGGARSVSAGHAASSHEMTSSRVNVSVLKSNVALSCLTRSLLASSSMNENCTWAFRLPRELKTAKRSEGASCKTWGARSEGTKHFEHLNSLSSSLRSSMIRPTKAPSHTLSPTLPEAPVNVSARKNLLTVNTGKRDPPSANGSAIPRGTTIFSMMACVERAYAMMAS